MTETVRATQSFGSPITLTVEGMPNEEATDGLNNRNVLVCVRFGIHEGQTPLMMAIKLKNQAAIELLRKQGAK